MSDIHFLSGFMEFDQENHLSGKMILYSLNFMIMKKICTVLLVTVFVFSLFSCKSSKKAAESNNKVSEVSQVDKNSQSLEEKAAKLACECIKQQGNVDDAKYKQCISASFLKAMDEIENPDEKSKLNDMNVLQTTVSKVESIVSLTCGPLSVKLKQAGVNVGYGSPNIKQKLVNDQMFLIKEYATDETYGYTESNPIMVGGAKEKEGVQNEIRYLKALTGPLGLPVVYKRLGSCCTFYSENGNDPGDGIRRGLLDIYEVMHDGLETPVKLYINMYDSDVLKVPVGGFTLKK